MPTPIKMPRLGETVAEGTIGAWLKQEGDMVEKDEALAEVITDKITAESSITSMRGAARPSSTAHAFPGSREICSWCPAGPGTNTTIPQPTSEPFSSRYVTPQRSLPSASIGKKPITSMAGINRLRATSRLSFREPEPVSPVPHRIMGKEISMKQKENLL